MSIGVHKPFRFAYFMKKKSFEIEEKKKLQHFLCYVVKEVFSVWELLFICTCLQYSQLLFRTNRGQKDRQREETTRCSDISVITYACLKAEYLPPLVPVHMEVKKKGPFPPTIHQLDQSIDHAIIKDEDSEYCVYLSWVHSC